jgi:prepilin-type N-terminal cleavage/methylation domain-containing protein
MKLKNIKNQGFTIIEVLIVLAIAGLIMLVVFLAVPALQRNSRNQQYRSEASRILTSTTEWTNNNNGATPVSANSGAILALSNNKQYTTLTIQSSTTLAAGLPSLTNAVLVTGAKCNSNAPVTGAARQIALMYAIEDSNGAATAQCLDS